MPRAYAVLRERAHMCGGRIPFMLSEIVLRVRLVDVLHDPVAVNLSQYRRCADSRLSKVPLDNGSSQIGKSGERSRLAQGLAMWEAKYRTPHRQH